MEDKGTKKEQNNNKGVTPEELRLIEGIKKEICEGGD